MSDRACGNWIYSVEHLALKFRIQGYMAVCRWLTKYTTFSILKPFNPVEYPGLLLIVTGAALLYFTSCSRQVVRNLAVRTHPIKQDTFSHQNSTDENEQVAYCDLFNTPSPARPVCGRPFSSKLIPFLEQFNLSDRQVRQMTEQDDHRILRTDPVYVTAFDDSHYEHAMKNVLKGFQEAFPAKKIIIYDLGLHPAHVQKLKGMPYVMEIRKFNYSAYPRYVRNLRRYQWKVLMLAEILREFDVVFYADAHIMWRKSWHVEDLLKRFQCQASGCSSTYYNLLLFGGVAHSIYATTDKRTYEYLPVDLERAKHVEMGQAGFQLIFNTRDVRMHVQKWNVLCALTRECMGPSWTKIPCKHPVEDRWTKFANCHRYDQSVVNILLANRNSYKVSKYLVPFYPTRG